MTALHTPTGRKPAIAAGLAACLLLVGAGFSMRTVILEEWHLHRLKDDSTRASSLQALLESGSPRVVSRLLKMIDASARCPGAPADKEVWFDHKGDLFPRGNMRVGLDSARFHLVIRGDPFYFKALLKLSLLHRDRAGDALISGTRSASPYVRYLSVLLLPIIGEEGRTRVVPLLWDALGDQELLVRTAGLAGLVARNAPLDCDALPGLVEPLKNLKLQVRWQASSWLAKGPCICPQIVRMLASLLSENDYDVRHMALYGLGMIGQRAREAVPALESRLAHEEDRDAVLMILSIVQGNDVQAPSRE